MPDRDALPRPAPPLSAAAPFISIIVPVYNDAAALASLLSALDEQDYQPDRFECLVVDNGSRVPVGVSPRRKYKIRVLPEPQAGSYAARNCGLRQARGDILAFTDADCMPRPDWLSAAVRHMQAARRPCILGGRLDVVREPQARDSALGWHSVVNDLDQERFVRHYHFAATANMFTTREVFERVGNFNPALLSGGDLEWGRRAWACGIEQVFCADVVVRHPARADWKSLVAKTRRIAGGHYGLNRQARRPLPATIHTTLQIAVASLRRSWRDPRLPTLGCRLQVLTIDAVLRLIQLGEVLRLGLGGRPCRR
jgi:glycosyltransferase involved in cell wall biosynthesis